MVAACVVFGSCSLKGKSEALSVSADANEWIEMDSFHLIMTEAFHPFTDSDNLEPVKQMAEELAQQIDRWEIENLPEKVDYTAMRAKIIQLKKDTRSLSDMIQQGSTDKEIKTSINSIQDSFHLIMEAWHAEAGELLQ